MVQIQLQIKKCYSLHIHQLQPNSRANLLESNNLNTEKLFFIKKVAMK